MKLVGRVAGIAGNVVQLENNLAEAIAGSHGRMARLLRRIDESVDALGAPAGRWPASPPAPLHELPSKHQPAVANREVGVAQFRHW